MKKRTLFSLCSRMFLVLVAVGFSSMAEGASVTFQDSDFTNVATDWQADAITARNSSGLITVTSVTVAQQANDGDDVGNVLNAEMVIGNHTGGRYLAMGAMYVGGTFDPSAMGAINSVDFGFTCDSDDTANPYIRPLLKQGGNYYAVTTGGPESNGSWRNTTVALTGLDSSDWNLVNVPGALGTADDFDTTSHPDFSETGGAITFGIWLNGVSSTSGGTTFTIDNDLDAFQVTVTYAEEPPVHDFEDSDFLDIPNDWQAVAIEARNSSGLIDITSVTVANQDGQLNAEMVIGNHTNGRYLAMGAVYVYEAFDPNVSGYLYSLDYGVMCAADDSENPFVRPLLRQDGNYYVIPTGGNQSNGSWKNATIALAGLGLNNWVKVNLPGTLGTTDDFDFNSHPDFSNTGDIIHFGVWVNGVSATSSGTSFAIDNDLDDFYVDVYTGTVPPPDMTPLPEVYTIPQVDMSVALTPVVVDQAAGTSLSHPDTVLLSDDLTLFAAYPEGYGTPNTILKKSIDGGLTWSGRLSTPVGFTAAHYAPTVHRLVDAAETERLLIMVSRPYFKQSISTDNGVTWSDFARIFAAGNDGLDGYTGTEPPKSIIKLQNGNFMAMYHDASTAPSSLYKIESSDGGLTWSVPVQVGQFMFMPGVVPAKPALIRSPDNTQLLCVMQDDARLYNALYMTSDDEGATWSYPQELPASLTGLRHVMHYAPDGRLVVAFHEIPKQIGPIRGDLIVWVGTYDDIIQQNGGEYRAILLDNRGLPLTDSGYSDLELLADDTFVCTAYNRMDRDDEPVIVSVRFTMTQLDAAVDAFQFCGQNSTVHLPGDLNLDCYVNIQDLLQLASEWLQ
jgi:hypothetical protein